MNLFPKIQPAPHQRGQDIFSLVLAVLERDGVIARTPVLAPPVIEHLPADDSEGGLL